MADVIAITTGGELTVGTAFGDAGSSVLLQAGLLKPGVSTAAVIQSSSLQKSGSLSLTSTGTAGVVLNERVTLANFGPKLEIKATAGSVALGAGNLLSVVGGNIKILAKGNITDSGTAADTNRYEAVGIVNASSGGVEFSAGTTSSTLSAAFGKKAGFYGFTSLSQIGSPQVLPGLPGQPVPVFRGVLLLNPSTASPTTPVDVSGTLDFTQGGALVLNTAGAGTINLNGNVKTTSSKPLVPVGDGEMIDADFVVDTEHDALTFQSDDF
jgi:hypothetical protein